MEASNQNERVLTLKPVLMQSILMNLTINQIKDIMTESKNEKMSRCCLNSLK